MGTPCKLQSTNSVRVPRRRPSVSPGVLSAPWRVPGVLTARAGGSAAAATVIARPGGRAEQPRTWLEGARLKGGNRSPPPTPDRKILSPASPKGPTLGVRLENVGWRGRSGKGGVGRAAAEGRRGDWERRAPGGDGRGPKGGDWTRADQSLPATFLQATVPSPSPTPALSLTGN